MSILLRRLLTGLVIAGLTVLLSPGLASAGSVSPVPFYQDQGGDPDQQFAMDAAQASVGNVLLGKLAVDRAASDDVRQFGQKMMIDNTRALAEASQLLLAAGIEPPIDPTPDTLQVIRGLVSSSGTDFDAAFMSQAVRVYRDHASALEAASIDRGATVAAFSARWLPTFEQELSSAENIARGLGVDPGSV
jgi:putative membrane protein